MISLILTILYLSISLLLYKSIPTSISETGYLWKGQINWFSVFCVVLAISLFIPWVGITPESYQFLCFLSCVGLLGCAVTPLFKEKYQTKVHYGGCILAILCWLIWMVLGGYWIVLGIDIAVMILLTVVNKKNWIFWGEIIAIITLGILII